MSHCRISRTQLPEAAHIQLRLKSTDFIDAYRVRSQLSVRQAAAIGFAVPAWARALLHLRNALVRPFGLKTDIEHGNPADRFGMFPVRYERDNELVLGFDDRHLDFRITFYREGTDMLMSTWVRPHNVFGRAYLAAVMPFHVLITRGAVRRIGNASKIAAGYSL